MPGPLAYGAVAVGSAVAGKSFRGSRAKPRDFGQFLTEFESQHGPERFGLTREQYMEALSGGQEGIRTERDVGSVRALSQLRAGGLGRSAAAAGVGLRSASAAEQAYTGLLSRLASVDAQMAQQQRTDLRREGIAAFEAQGREDSRVAAQNAQDDVMLGQMIQSFVDPIENYYLLRDLRAMRGLSFQPSAFRAGTTEDLFRTQEAMGAFDLSLGG